MDYAQTASFNSVEATSRFDRQASNTGAGYINSLGIILMKGVDPIGAFMDHGVPIEGRGPGGSTEVAEVRHPRVLCIPLGLGNRIKWTGSSST